MDYKVISGDDSWEKRSITYFSFHSGLPFHFCYVWLNRFMVVAFLAKLSPIAGVPRLNTPPLLSNTSTTSKEERLVAAPRPIRTTPNLVTRLEDLSQPWTRSPTKSNMDPVLATWHFISSDPSHGDSSVIGISPFFITKFAIYADAVLMNCTIWVFPSISCFDCSHEATTGSSSFRDTMKLAPMPDSYDLDRGLLLSVQAIQVSTRSHKIGFTFMKCINFYLAYTCPFYVRLYQRIKVTPL